MPGAGPAGQFAEFVAPLVIGGAVDPPDRDEVVGECAIELARRDVVQRGCSQKYLVIDGVGDHDHRSGDVEVHDRGDMRAQGGDPLSDRLGESRVDHAGCGV